MRQKNIIILFLTMCIFSILINEAPSNQSFREQQKQYKRVRTAYSEKEAYIRSLLETHGIRSLAIEIYIRAFKLERELEIWARERNSENKEYLLVKTYYFTSYSGQLGPKQKQGDFQIPEGFYYINRYNPFSSFYLSLGLNYPNQVDRKRAGSNNPGGDIFIHGDRVTIGCIPIGNSNIKELYLLAVEAKHHGQVKIPVHIFPYRFSDQATSEKITKEYKDERATLIFWNTLEKGFTLFEKNKHPPLVTIDRKCSYSIN